MFSPTGDLHELVQVGRATHADQTFKRARHPSYDEQDAPPRQLGALLPDLLEIRADRGRQIPSLLICSGLAPYCGYRAVDVGDRAVLDFHNSQPQRLHPLFQTNGILLDHHQVGPQAQDHLEVRLGVGPHLGDRPGFLRIAAEGCHSDHAPAEPKGEQRLGD